MSEDLKEKERRENFIPMVRAMVKISSALLDADTVENGRYFKFKFKKSLQKWVDKMEKATKPFMSQFVETSQEALYEAYERFREFSEGTSIKNADRTALIVLYCKAKSASNDLHEMSVDDSGMIGHILMKYTEDMLKDIENQYSDIFNIKDANGNTIEFIVKGYDELGKSMFKID